MVVANRKRWLSEKKRERRFSHHPRRRRRRRRRRPVVVELQRSWGEPALLEDLHRRLSLS
jgi:hypothetical protein